MKMIRSWLAVVSLSLVFCQNISKVSNGRKGNGIKLRISNGEDAVRGEFPFAALLLIDKVYMSSSTKQSVCGGSVVSANTILTAAHCVINEVEEGGDKIDILYRPQNIHIYAGDHDLKNRESTEQYRKPKGIIIHKDYNSKTVENDIALIILDRDLDLSTAAVSTITLPDSDSYYSTGSAITVVGWGTTAEGKVAESLQKLSYVVSPSSACADNYGSHRIVSGMMCTGDTPDVATKHAATGDSGGPLFIKDSDNRFVQLGIVSWGSVDQSETSYDVNVNVFYYKSWITESMKSIGEYTQRLRATTAVQTTYFSSLRNYLYKTVIISPSDINNYVQIKIVSGVIDHKDLIRIYDGNEVLKSTRESARLLAELSGKLSEITFTSTSHAGLTMVIVTSSSAESDTFSMEYSQVKSAGFCRSLVCGAGYYPCTDGRFCVLSHQVCDGNEATQCIDGSDENTKACSDKSNGFIDNFTDNINNGYVDCYGIKRRHDRGHVNSANPPFQHVFILFVLRIIL